MEVTSTAFSEDLLANSLEPPLPFSIDGLDLSAIDEQLLKEFQTPLPPKKEANSLVQAYAKLKFENFSFYVQTLSLILGRQVTDSDKIDVHLGSSKSISRKHARIYYNFALQCFEITIMGKNGAFLNDKFVDQGQTVPLLHKTKIQIGEIAFYFLLPKADDEDAELGSDSEEGLILTPVKLPSLAVGEVQDNKSSRAINVTKAAQVTPTKKEAKAAAAAATSTGPGRIKGSTKASTLLGKRSNESSGPASGETKQTKKAKQEAQANAKATAAAAAAATVPVPVPAISQPQLQTNPVNPEIQPHTTSQPHQQVQDKPQKPQKQQKQQKQQKERKQEPPQQQPQTHAQPKSLPPQLQLQQQQQPLLQQQQQQVQAFQQENMQQAQAAPVAVISTLATENAKTASTTSVTTSSTASTTTPTSPASPAAASPTAASSSIYTSPIRQAYSSFQRLKAYFETSGKTAEEKAQKSERPLASNINRTVAAAADGSPSPVPTNAANIVNKLTTTNPSKAISAASSSSASNTTSTVKPTLGTLKSNAPQPLILRNGHLYLNPLIKGDSGSQTTGTRTLVFFFYIYIYIFFFFFKPQV